MLRRLWQQGETEARIAQALADAFREAISTAMVTYAAARLGLPDRVMEPTQRQRFDRVPVPPMKPRAPGTDPLDFRPQEVRDRISADLHHAERMRLLGYDRLIAPSATCMWPTVSDPVRALRSGQSQIYCGKQSRTGASWCPEHAAIVFDPPRTKI